MQLTTRLGLKKPDGSDDFRRVDINDNWDALEASPGVFICTSETRPAWGDDEVDRLIFETDTLRIRSWSGAKFMPVSPPVKHFTRASTTTSFAASSPSATNIPGLEYAMDLVVATEFLVTFTGHFLIPGGGTNVNVRVFLDGIPQAGRITIEPKVGAGLTAALPVAQQWKVSVPSGAHTLSIRASCSGTSESVVVDSTSSVTYEVL